MSLRAALSLSARSRTRRTDRVRIRSRRRSTAAAAGVVGAVLAVGVLTGSGTANAATMAEFHRLAQCESGGDYRINTGNGYYGAYQFSLPTWRGLGYSGYPHQAPPAVQDEAAVKLQARSGWGQWPACSRKLGLRSSRGLVGAAPPAPRPASLIDQRYAGSPEVRAALGAPRGAEFAVRGGAVRVYERGQLVWSGPTGAKAVYGDIFEEYGEHRWEQGRLGFPVTDELPVPGGRQSLFQHGVIAWSPGTGAQVLVGDIRKRYEAIGGVSSPLGFPTGGEQREAGGVSQSFARGAMFWDADTRATTPLQGPVLAAYRAAGGPAGELGMPLEASTGAGGTEVEFEGGTITQAPGSRRATVVTD